ncbi:MAG: winged helix DNA-binding domain-containing protein [Acidobacteria bacterium]|nr:MAG: winged helix DNA-binding domain-containing protein [Acidobacteriota bacterium]
MGTSPVISDRQLNRATLARQLLLERTAMPVVKAIEQVLALQAQVPRPPHVGLWSRLPAFEREHLHVPLRSRALVRATTMRGTLHIMSAKDFLAFRGALQESLTAGVRPVVGNAPLPPVDVLVAAARKILAREPLTFNEIRAALVKQFPKSHDRLMGYTVRMHLPLVQVPTEDDVWGFPSDSAFAPADAWIKKPVGQGDGPAKLVLRYLAAFGPASSADIQAWTGLRGVAEIVKPLRSKLVTFTDARGRELFDLPKAPRPDADTDAPVRFLPEYDSVVIGHADRSRLVDEKYRKALVTKNLIVPPTFLVDGRIAGTWKIERKKAAATLQLAPFAPLTKSVRRELEREGEALAHFVEPDAKEFVVR